VKDAPAQLVAAGMSRANAQAKAELFGQALAALRAMAISGVQQPLRFFVPGRIEVMGKHTDYAGGRSLLCAIECGICLVATPRADNQLRILDAASNLETCFRISPDGMPEGHDWSIYPRTVARRVAQNFSGACCGADIAFASDLPRAAGLSSSSALIVAFFCVLSESNGLEQRAEYRANIQTRDELASYLGAVENGLDFGSLRGDLGVGTFGGSQDHTAILCCAPGVLSQYSFCPVRHEMLVPMPEGYVFVVAASGVEASKIGEARASYNRASLGVSAILRLWCEATGRADETLAQAAVSAPDAPRQIRALLRSVGLEEIHQGHFAFSARELVDRFEAFVGESMGLVSAVAEALARADLRRAGDLVDQSQRQAELWLGNQIPQTIALARSARELGAAAASAFGAGFGGSVWALVKADSAADFSSRWMATYSDLFPQTAGAARFFSTRPGPSLMRL
jgi:galactokinase